MSFDAGEAADERRSVSRLELVELRGVDDARDHFAHVVAVARIARNDAVELARVVLRRQWFEPFPRRRMIRPQITHDLANERERVRIVVREMVRNAGDARVHVAAAELFGADHLPSRGFDERRTAEKDRAGTFDDHRLVAHRRNVRAARRARSHDRGDLRDAFARHARLIVEDAAEVVAIGKHFVLQRQERAARIDEIDARKKVLLGDLLCAQMFLHRYGIVRAALDGRIVRDDDAALVFDRADARDHPGRRAVAAVHLVCGEGADLEKVRLRIDEPVDALAGGELAARSVTLRRLRAAARPNREQMLAQVGYQLLHARRITLEVGALTVEARGEQAHRASAFR